MEALVTKLCEAYPSNIQRKGSTTLRWTLVSRAYKKIRDAILNNARIMEETSIQLAEINNTTLIQWYVDKLLVIHLGAILNCLKNNWKYAKINCISNRLTNKFLTVYFNYYFTSGSTNVQKTRRTVYFSRASHSPPHHYLPQNLFHCQMNCLHPLPKGQNQTIMSSPFHPTLLVSLRCEGLSFFLNHQHNLHPHPT